MCPAEEEHRHKVPLMLIDHSGVSILSKYALRSEEGPEGPGRGQSNSGEKQAISRVRHHVINI
jgi:hypothetical protein